MAEHSPQLKAMAGGMVAAVRSAIARAIAPIGTRLSATETRVGALSMVLGRGEAADKIAAFEALIARMDKQAQHISALQKEVAAIQRKQQ